MIDISTAGRGLGNEILNLIRGSADTMADALQAWASAVQYVTPSLAKASMPHADLLPKPGTLVNGVYDFAEQLLSAQRKFADDVLKVTAPLTGQRAAS